jgi:hypothetical protein
MKIKFLSNYRKVETGNVVYRYAVSGTPEQLAAYAEAQGENHKIDEETGAPLWFSVRYIGETGELGISRNGTVFADTSEFDKANSLCEQYKGTALGEQLARVMAEKLLGNMEAGKPSTPATKPANADLGKL